MPIPVTIPRLGWNMEEGTFVEWLKAHGDAVRPGEVLYKLEGEKSVEEIESLDGGTLHIPPSAPKPGDRVAVGTVIAQLLQSGEVPTELGQEKRTVAPEPAPMQPETTPALREQVPASTVAISPRARRLAVRHGIDWSGIRGSGRGGRIRERDVAAIERVSATPRAAEVGHTSLRKAIAARMVESRRTTAPVTLTSIVDAANLVNLRHQFKAAGQGESQAVPSFTDMLAKLVAFAIQKHPVIASRWTDTGLLPAERINIGIAVDTDAGLLVPVVQDVPALGLRQVAAKSRGLIERARSGKLSSRDMEGGCFTITNLGAYGIDAFTPIINVPEAAILGVGCIERRPVMDGDRVVGREQVTLSLTFDHRVVDGAPAARFLQTLAGMIANPGAWLTS